MDGIHFSSLARRVSRGNRPGCCTGGQAAKKRIAFADTTLHQRSRDGADLLFSGREDRRAGAGRARRARDRCVPEPADLVGLRSRRPMESAGGHGLSGACHFGLARQIRRGAGNHGCASGTTDSAPMESSGLEAADQRAEKNLKGTEGTAPDFRKNCARNSATPAQFTADISAGNESRAIYTKCGAASSRSGGALRGMDSRARAGCRWAR